MTGRKSGIVFGIMSECSEFDLHPQNTVPYVGLRAITLYHEFDDDLVYKLNQLKCKETGTYRACGFVKEIDSS